jgi:predicted Mrr-cat superfamily restriction endonuclease
MDRKYLMVRAMSSSQADFDIFFKNSVVAVGWSEINFSEFDKERIEHLLGSVEKEYYNSEGILPQVIGRQLNQVRRFHNINKGDYIIIPFYNSIRLAIADDKILYDESVYDNDLANQRKVSYQYSGDTYKTIPRDVLSEAFQRRLRVRGSTVSDLYEFKDEIEKLFSQDNYSWTSDFEDKENELKALLKAKLLNKIRIGKTNLKTGGLGLEYLVKELFICEGYKTEVLAKTTFQFGDADIYAVKSDKFQETKILIQVKHHNGYTDDWGLQQLSEIKSSEAYKDCKFVLITSAEISEGVRKIAEDLDIAAMDGNEFVDWLIENLHNLSIETKIKLGLSAIPQIAD